MASISEAPQVITDSFLWPLLEADPELAQSVLDIRETAGRLAQESARIVPGFTDHSLSHMDELWRIAGKVVSDQEQEKFSTGESFVLAASFYVHDLGMAYAATEFGIQEIRATNEYVAHFDQVRNVQDIAPEHADRIALQAATRQLHAHKAHELASKKLPGIDRFLIEKSTIREQWADWIGDVSASHHWSLTELDSRIGDRDRVPDPCDGETDLGYVACLLRVIDFAHINFKRATYIDRVLRSYLPPDSLVHWQAQEVISGPIRRSDRLVYSSQRPIDNVDAWWLFYEMACGLDQEIATVNEYLGQRLVSQQRFSLEGVKDVREPTLFARLVRPKDFEPVDVQFRPESMERLVEILGGKTLYGNDQWAPIRELLQNARDAVELRHVSEAATERHPVDGKIHVRIEDCDGRNWLSIEDNGTGMSQLVVTKYLLGIASNYWQSIDYHAEYPHARQSGFKPTGRFGIGFLSVFMIGDTVRVVTRSKHAQAAYRLEITGVGQRGALRQVPAELTNGTVISVLVEKQDCPTFKKLLNVVRARAPMVNFQIEVSSESESLSISVEWWRGCSQDSFLEFIRKWRSHAFGGRVNEYRSYFVRRRVGYIVSNNDEDPYTAAKQLWQGSIPEISGDSYRVLAVPTGGELILCCKGIAVDSIYEEGLVGIIDVPDLDLNASRTEAIGFDTAELVEHLKRELLPQVVEGLSAFDQSVNVPLRYEMFNAVANYYGIETLCDARLRWITVVERPGSAILVFPDELRKRVERAKQTIIAFGVGGWGAWRVISRMDLDVDPDALVICVPDWDQPSFGRIREEAEYVEGTLEDHFKSEYASDPTGEEWRNAHLLTAVLHIIGGVMGVSADEIAQYQWIRKRDSYLVCVI